MLTYNKNSTNHSYVNRMLIGTPTTGIIRMEWALARFGQVIPTNWSSADCIQWLSTYCPIEYQIPDAQNLIVKAALERDTEWLLLIEHDNVLPHGTFLQFNEYMRKCDVPIVSGLYFTKTVPPEPMVYKKHGCSFAIDWKLGDKVWVCAVPMGCCLIHGSILKTLWEESPEYKIGDQITRRVFDAPARAWYDPETGGVQSETGTSDFAFCNRVVRENIFAKAGWSKFARRKLPFLVDTNIFTRHIDQAGRQFPLSMPEEFLPNAKQTPKKKAIT